MSSATNPSTHYRVPFFERVLGAGKLKPPSTYDVPNVDFPMTIQLGEYKLDMNEHGQWKLSGDVVSMYQQQIRELESKISVYESERSSRSVYDLERKSIDLERQLLTSTNENNTLKFKNKVLLAMCTISEGDYKSLCREAGIEPRQSIAPSASSSSSSSSSATVATTAPSAAKTSSSSSSSSATVPPTNTATRSNNNNNNNNSDNNSGSETVIKTERQKDRERASRREDRSNNDNIQSA